MIKDACMTLAGFALACCFLYIPAHADTVLHVMVYNVQAPTPTEHTVFRMPSREVCEASVSNWDGLANDAGDRSEARCIEVVELSEIEK